MGCSTWGCGCRPAWPIVFSSEGRQLRVPGGPPGLAGASLQLGSLSGPPILWRWVPSTGPWSLGNRRQAPSAFHVNGSHGSQGSPLSWRVPFSPVRTCSFSLAPTQAPRSPAACQFCWGSLGCGRCKTKISSLGCYTHPAGQAVRTSRGTRKPFVIPGRDGCGRK